MAYNPTLATPNIRLKFDTGLLATDGITNDGHLTEATNLVANAIVYYQVLFVPQASVLAGSNFGMQIRDITTTYAPPPTNGSADGLYIVQFGQVDKFNPNSYSAFSFVAFILDSTPPATPNARLRVDSGTSSTDGITNNAALIVPTNIEAGAKVEYAIQSGIDAFGAWGTTYTAPSVDGNFTVKVRQTDAAGNASVQTINFTLDTKIPATPNTSLAIDSGLSSTDAITNSGVLTAASNVEAGARLEYAVSKNGGLYSDWSTSYNAPLTDGTADGRYSVKVRQVDLAGNLSQKNRRIIDFTLDTTAASAPTVSLLTDTGTAGDNLTNSAAINVQAEAGATVEYRLKSGVGTFGNWSTTYAQPATDGSYTVEVRQTDVAGNVSAAHSVSFELDTLAPLAPVVKLQADSGKATDAVTKLADLSVQGQAGTTVEYRIKSENGNFDAWSSSYAKPTADGRYTVEVRQADTAGNVSATKALAFALDTTAPAKPNVATTSGGNISIDGKLLAPTNTEPGAVVQYKTTCYGTDFTNVTGTAWSEFYQAPSRAGMSSVAVRQMDSAGNFSSEQSILVSLATPPTDYLTAFSDKVGTNSGIRSSVESSGFTYDHTLDLSGVGHAGDVLSIYDNASVSLGSTVVSSNGTWIFSTPLLANGAHAFSAQSVDSVGASNITAGPTINVCDSLVTDHAWSTRSGWGLVDALAAINLATGQHLADVQAPSTLNPNKAAAVENAYDAWTYGYTGKGIVVAHLDFGFDHSDTRLTACKSPYSWNFSTNTADVTGDASSHGTLTLGGMVGVAPDVTHMDLVPGGTVRDEDALIHYAVDHGANIVTTALYLGGSSEGMKYARDHNVLVIGSAGYDALPHDPAYFSTEFANVLAAGYYDSWQGWHAGGASAGVGPYGYLFAVGGTNSETSGTLAGLASLVWQANPDLSADQVAQVMMQTAHPIL